MPEQKRILVIDDDLDLRELLKMGLDMAGYKTFTARNGAEAVSIIKDAQLDLILVDLVMPVMDGLRFLRWLRCEAKSPLPAFVLTSYKNDDIVVEAMGAGATGVIFKPVGLPELVDKMTKYFDTAV